MTGNKIKQLSLIGLSLLLSGLTQAQTSINASGGNTTGSGGSVSYSVGQLVYDTYSTNDGSLAQGVQHTYDILTVKVDKTGIDISLSIYPNPTSGKLVLQVKNLANTNLAFNLFDLQGHLLKTDKITSDKSVIDMSDLPIATYVINVQQGNRKIKEFKVIKK